MSSYLGYDSNFCFDIWRVTNAYYLLTYLGYPVFNNSKKKFISVFVRVFTKSRAMGHSFYKSNYRLENYHAVVSLIL